MKKSRVTISDLARSLDLSLCTVSKILNRSFDGFTYSRKTIARVETEAKRLGYRPNPQAQSLRTRRSHLIGFVLPTAEIALFGSLTDRLEHELRRRGYQVLITHSRNDTRIEAQIIPELLARSVDGVIWIPASSRVNLKRVGIRSDFPMVILDRPGCTSAVPFVATENREAARELAKRVYDLGHRCVGVLNASANDQSMRERFIGIQDIFGDEICLKDTSNQAEVARSATVDLFKGQRKFSVVFALSEPLAIGALTGLHDLQLRIPENISFAAFDDFPLASQWSPPITVIQQDVEGLASVAADLVIKRIKAPRKRIASARIPAFVKWRGSVIAQ